MGRVHWSLGITVAAGVLGGYLSAQMVDASIGNAASALDSYLAVRRIDLSRDRLQPDPLFGVRRVSDAEYVIDKSALCWRPTNVDDLESPAGIRPSFENGVCRGMRFVAVKPSSMYAKLGIENGDVVRRVNGYEMVCDPDGALELSNKLRDATRIDVEIERPRRIVRKIYWIE